MMGDGFLQVLRKEHDEVKGIFRELEKAVEEGAGRKRLFGKLRRELRPHMDAEEKAFYPPLVQSEEAREETLESIEEHHVARVLLDEMDGLDEKDERWEAKLSVLKENVEHHIQEEEKALFRKARRVLDAESLREIASRFEEQKEKARQSLG